MAKAKKAAVDANEKSPARRKAALKKKEGTAQEVAARGRLSNAGPRMEMAIYSPQIIADVPTTIAFTHKVIEGCPPEVLKHPSASLDQVRGAYGLMVSHLGELIDVWGALTSPDQIRPEHDLWVGGWASMVLRLEGAVRLNDAESPRVTELLNTFLSERLSFTKVAFDTSWVEGDKRITQMRRKGVLAEVAEIVGEKYMSTLLSRHAKLGQLLGLTKKKSTGGVGVVPAPKPGLVLGYLQAVRIAVSDYSQQCVAAHNNNPNRAIRKLMLAALEPVDTARNEHNARSGGEGRKEDSVPAGPDVVPPSLPPKGGEVVSPVAVPVAGAVPKA